MASSPQVTVDSIRQRVAGSFPPTRDRADGDHRRAHRPGGSSTSATCIPGLVHGGVWVALTDTRRGLADVSPPPGHDTTLELKLNVFAGATTGDELIAEGTHLHAGRPAPVSRSA